MSKGSDHNMFICSSRQTGSEPLASDPLINSEHATKGVQAFTERTTEGAETVHRGLNDRGKNRF